MAKSESITASTQNLQLHGIRYGKGRFPVLAFHGYGQEAAAFKPFSDLLPQYSVYSFDLPFHGYSHYTRQDQPLAIPEWQEAIGKFLAEHNIKRFSIAAYSMGGKFALALILAFADRIDNAYLVAPDGISTSFWYSMSTYPRWARNYFKKLVEEPKPFFKLANTLNRYKLMDSGILKFAEWHMNTPAKRRKVYNSWTSSSHFRFNMKQLAQTITKAKINLELFIGKHDKIMTPTGMHKLTRYLPQAAYKMHILPSGHSGLILASAKLLSSTK